MEILNYDAMLSDDEALASELPSQVVRDKADMVTETFADIVDDLQKLRGRMDQAAQFVQMSAVYGPCRCIAPGDPSCLPCKARSILSQWGIQDQAPSQASPH